MNHQEVFKKYADTIEGLQTHIISNNLDISTPEKFNEAFRSYLASQKKFYDHLQEMPIKNVMRILKIK